jgi:hypothetical protein
MIYARPDFVTSTENVLLDICYAATSSSSIAQKRIDPFAKTSVAPSQHANALVYKAIDGCRGYA